MYEMLQKSALFCLPHSKTFRRLTTALQVKKCLGSTTMAYLEMQIKKLEPRECLVNLAMDEVYTSKSVEINGWGQSVLRNRRGRNRPYFVLT